MSQFVAELQMDTAELSVKMSYKVSKIKWASEGSTQAELAENPRVYVKRHEMMKCGPDARSNADLRP